MSTIKTKRYRALDVLRGFTIAAMILVNTPGSWSHVYAPLLHAAWHGVTPTDFIFPFFLFIVGVSLFFSQAKKNTLEHLRIMKRTALLFIIGVLLNAYPFVEPLADLRIMGVLQRIALVYFFAAYLCALPQAGRLLASVFLLVVYALIFFVVDPAYTLAGNPVLVLDQAIFGEQHLYQGHGTAFDPEGLLSTMPAIVSAICGFEVANILATRAEKPAISRLLIVALVLLVLSVGLSPWVPINKSLWTPSFVLLTSAVAILFLLLIHALENKKAFTTVVWIFEVIGKNPLFIYIISWLWVATYWLIPVVNTNLYDFLFLQLDRVFPANLASLVFALLHVALFWFIAWLLHRRNIVIAI